MEKIVFIGSGNLATPVAKALHEAGVEILQVWSHSIENAESLASAVGASATDDLHALRSDADIYIYAVKDAYLQEVVETVGSYICSGLHVHTAGSMPRNVFDGIQKRHGVFYPYQSFSKSRTVDFTAIPIFLEADEADYGILRALSMRITSMVYCANSSQRKRIHLAGVFANNFSNCMYLICKELIEEVGLPFEAMYSLIDETAAKIHVLDPLEAQTGPAKRRDTNVMEAHKAMLDDDKRAIYEAVSHYIMKRP